MTISQKTRKVLWARSGNRCAICRKELVLETNTSDRESLVGEECHIVSPKENGPRYDPEFDEKKVDEQENLILLCGVHHKMVDDQTETYTVDGVRNLKATHEQWVSTTLSETEEKIPVQIKQIKGNIPSHLFRIQSGNELMGVIGESMGYIFDNQELKSEDEVELVSIFFQNAQDWGDLWRELESGERVKASYHMGLQIKELEAAGLLVFGALEKRQMEGGIAPPSAFPIVHLRIVRAEDPNIIEIGS